MEELISCLKEMDQGLMGSVLRAKGIVPGTNGYMNMQYLPGDIQISNCTTGGDMLCIIGQNLKRQELVSLFKGAEFNQAA